MTDATNPPEDGEEKKESNPPIMFNKKILEEITTAIATCAGEIGQVTQAFLTLEKGCAMMYETTMENHKRLNRLEKEFLALEKKVNEKDNPR